MYVIFVVVGYSCVNCLRVSYNENEVDIVELFLGFFRWKGK